MYTIDVCLIPKISAEFDDVTTSRIHRSITQHDQVMSNIGHTNVPGISYLDLPIKISKKHYIPRELILNFRSTIDNCNIFISINQNYNKTIYEIKYKKKYESETKLMASKMGELLLKNTAKESWQCLYPIIK